MGKGQIGVEEFVVIAAFAFAFVVFLFILGPKIWLALSGAGETGVCNWNLLVHAFTKMGGKEIVPAECQAKRITVDEPMLNAQLKYASRRMNKMLEEAKDEKLKEQYKLILKQFNDPKNEQQLYEFALNKIVADELKNCWTKVFQGKLPLFDEWYNKFDLRLWGIFAEDKELKEMNEKDFITAWKGLGIANVYGPPTFCVICSRIKFDKNIEKKLGKSKVTSLKDWLSFNPMPRTNEPYMRFLADGRTKAHDSEEGQPSENALYFQKFDYSISVEEPLAVLYSRVNTYKATQWVGNVGGWLGITEAPQEAVDRLAIIPYNNVAKSYSEVGQEAGNCVVIID